MTRIAGIHWEPRHHHRSRSLGRKDDVSKEEGREGEDLLAHTCIHLLAFSGVCAVRTSSRNSFAVNFNVKYLIHIPVPHFSSSFTISLSFTICYTYSCVNTFFCTLLLFPCCCVLKKLLLCLNTTTKSILKNTHTHEPQSTTSKTCYYTQRTTR